ncbi:helix-turn-helix transcriptional regulator [Flavobacterium rhizosphaerae]|uniref:YafY family protein n=1 Tax=Flavobacterium rhizosphaerae TaxID=3163298 RepID=A0ABW8YVN0_9FLAO
MNRFDRITAILIQLQSKKVVKAQDLAQRFDISLRTVYRDIRSLEEAGVPIYGEAGLGYMLVDGYRLPPVMFTPEEATAFVAAEKLMEKFTDAATREQFASAMFKVKAVLRSNEKDLVEKLDSHILIKNSKTNNNKPENYLNVLLKAISDKKAVDIEYKTFGNDEVTSRLIEPIGVFHENDNWYTIAYCHLRETYRQFRLDRIISLAKTDISQQERVSLQEYEAQQQEKALPALQKAVICFDKSVVPYIQSRRHFYGFVSETITNDGVEMTFLTQSLEEGLARWYLSFADYAKIIEPQKLKDRIVELLGEILVKVKV